MQVVNKQRKRDDRPYIKKVEFVFYNEAAIREAIIDARAGSNTPELRNGSGLPDPTASAAIRNLSPVHSVRIEGVDLLYPESWLTVVDKTYAWCKRQGGKYYEMARGRYSGKYFAKICTEVEVVAEKFFRVIEKIRNYAALQAAQLNLIHVD